MSGRTDRARRKRKEPTDAEARLWRHLRNRQVEGAKFRREEPVLNYFADLLCEEIRLIVEADGGQHTPEGDAARTRELEAAGYTVLRFGITIFSETPRVSWKRSLEPFSLLDPLSHRERVVQT